MLRLSELRRNANVPTYALKVIKQIGWGEGEGKEFLLGRVDSKLASIFLAISSSEFAR